MIMFYKRRCLNMEEKDEQVGPEGIMSNNPSTVLNAITRVIVETYDFCYFRGANEANLSWGCHSET